MNNFELEGYLSQYLNASAIHDYCPNGLQVQGKSEVKKIITGVTASQELLNIAIKEQADAVIVHHGIFWKGDRQEVKGILYHRLKALLDHDINLYAYHLPLDAHKECGNNVLLAQFFNAKIVDWCDSFESFPMVPFAFLEKPLALKELVSRIDQTFNRKSYFVGDENRIIKTLAWCSGSASEFLDLAAQKGADVFITGEFPERVVHAARELGIAVIAAGHHDTETVGIKRLGEILSEKLDLNCTFVNLSNPL